MGPNEGCWCVSDVEQAQSLSTHTHTHTPSSGAREHSPSLSAAGPGRFSGQSFATDFYHIIPYHTIPYLTIPCHAIPHHEANHGANQNAISLYA